MENAMRGLKSKTQIEREAELFPVLRDRFEAAGYPPHEAERRAADVAERQVELELEREVWEADEDAAEKPVVTPVRVIE
jgi:hypothetical protein